MKVAVGHLPAAVGGIKSSFYRENHKLHDDTTAPPKLNADLDLLLHTDRRLKGGGEPRGYNILSSYVQTQKSVDLCVRNFLLDTEERNI